MPFIQGHVAQERTISRLRGDLFTKKELAGSENIAFMFGKLVPKSKFKVHAAPVYSKILNYQGAEGALAREACFPAGYLGADSEV